MKHAPAWLQLTTKFSGLALMAWSLWRASQQLPQTLLEALTLGVPFLLGGVLWSDSAVERAARAVNEIRKGD